MKKVAYLGTMGSYSFLAAQYMMKNALYIGKPDFKNVLEGVKRGEADAAILPIENSTTGSIFEVYDLLLEEKKLTIVQEGVLKINHLLLGKTKDITMCYCHPEAGKQCRKYLSLNNIKPIFVEDTGTAVKKALAYAQGFRGAIGNAYLAKKYRLPVISDSIQENTDNYTRFIRIEKANPAEGEKVTVVFSLIHKPGSLLKALGSYAKYGLNLTKIESRPILSKPWEYIFIVDFLIENTKSMEKAIKEMKERTTFLKVVGLYPRGKIYEA